MKQGQRIQKMKLFHFSFENDFKKITLKNDLENKKNKTRRNRKIYGSVRKITWKNRPECYSFLCINIRSKFTPIPIKDVALKQTDESKQSYLNHYPFSLKQKESSWHKTRPWLTLQMMQYFASLAVFTRTQRLIVPLIDGFSNWKKAMESSLGLRQYENSLAHKNCMVAWVSFKQLGKTTVKMLQLLRYRGSVCS